MAKLTRHFLHNLFLCHLNIPTKQFDNDADWTKDNNGNYDGDFYRDCHEKIKAMKRKGLAPKALCVYF